MRIDCPTCQAAYDVPDAVIAAGRTLRCARCGVDFVPAGAPAPGVAAPAPPVSTPPVSTPPASTPPPPAPVAPALVAEKVAERAFVAPGEMARLVQAARLDQAERGPVLAVAAAWVLSLVVLLAIGWMAVAYREPIARAWPPATRVYAALGYGY